MKKIALYGLLIAMLCGGGIAWYQYNKPHVNIEKTAADVVIAAQALYEAYERDEADANALYLGKIIQVSGVVTEVTQDEEGIAKIFLDSGNPLGGVICQLDPLSKHLRTNFEEGEEIALKGKCDGMLMDVVITRCIEISKQ